MLSEYMQELLTELKEKLQAHANAKHALDVAEANNKIAYATFQSALLAEDPKLSEWKAKAQAEKHTASLTETVNVMKMQLYRAEAELEVVREKLKTYHVNGLEGSPPVVLNVTEQPHA